MGEPPAKKSRLVFEQVRNKRTIAKLDSDVEQVSDSDLIIDDEDNQILKKRKVGIKNSREPLNLDCEWADCSSQFTNFELYVKHVNTHVSKSSDFDYNDGVFKCEFKNCSYQHENFDALDHHVDFHCYHKKLINIGLNILERNKLPKCTDVEPFQIPHLAAYFCEWDNCKTKISLYTQFLTHIKIHMLRIDTKYCKKGETMKCLWMGCSCKFTSVYKLMDHLRTHTKEKLIACPGCGQLFASKTKFIDHRNRQLTYELQSYQCSQCSKLFPSERLLRNHMRSHINQYKCSMCDMTCQTPSILARHIRCRHLDERFYKCHLCQHRTFNKNHLEQHLTTHCDDKLMACVDCDFRCRSLYGLDRHYQLVHGHGVGPIYECHCCQDTFNRGTYLTKHLIKKHGYSWPSGHSRFRYKEESDGIYRLETVRYESIEVTQEMIKKQEQATTSALKPMRYNLRRKKMQSNASNSDNDAQSEFAFEIIAVPDHSKSDSLKEQNLDVAESSDSSSDIYDLKMNGINDRIAKNILIEVDDVDVDGNVIKTHKMETKEIFSDNAVDATIIN